MISIVHIPAIKTPRISLNNNCCAGKGTYTWVHQPCSIEESTCWNKHQTQTILKSTCRNDDRTLTILQTSSWFAGWNADVLNIDMQKRTLFAVGSAKQTCFPELNSYHPEKQPLFVGLNSFDLNKQSWFVVSSAYDPCIMMLFANRTPSIVLIHPLSQYSFCAGALPATN